MDVGCPAIIKAHAGVDLKKFTIIKVDLNHKHHIAPWPRMGIPLYFQDLIYLWHHSNEIQRQDLDRQLKAVVSGMPPFGAPKLDVETQTRQISWSSTEAHTCDNEEGINSNFILFR